MPSAMQRVLDLLRLGGASYKPLDDNAEHDEQDSLMGGTEEHERTAGLAEAPFSTLHYAVFTLLGVATLWAWCVQAFHMRCPS
jgi:hypothetical protein